MSSMDTGTRRKICLLLEKIRSKVYNLDIDDDTYFEMDRHINEVKNILVRKTTSRGGGRRPAAKTTTGPMVDIDLFDLTQHIVVQDEALKKNVQDVLGRELNKHGIRHAFQDDILASKKKGTFAIVVLRSVAGMGNFLEHGVTSEMFSQRRRTNTDRLAQSDDGIVAKYNGNVIIVDLSHQDYDDEPEKEFVEISPYQEGRVPHVRLLFGEDGNINMSFNYNKNEMKKLMDYIQVKNVINV
jgi:hypothetical protein